MRFPEIKNTAAYQWWHRKYRLVSKTDEKLIAVSWKAEREPRKIELVRKEGEKFSKSLDRLKEEINKNTTGELEDLPEMINNKNSSGGGGQLSLSF